MKVKHWLWLSVALFCGSMTMVPLDESDIGAALFLGMFATLIAAAIQSYREDAPKREERKKQRAEQKSERQEQARVQQEEWEKRREEKRLAKNRATTIAEVRLLEGGSMYYRSGGLSGGIMGGLVGGPLGAVIGATSKKGRGVQLQKFAIKYVDGHVEIQEHHPNSWEYKRLMKMVKWDDLFEN